MKQNKFNNLSRAFALTIVLIALFLIIVVRSYAYDPVPGLDISIEQIPGGKQMTTKTDRNGEFLFKDLPSGKIIIKLIQPPPNKIIKKDVKSSLTKDSKTYINVTFTLIDNGHDSSTDGKNKKVEITIGPKGGNISGKVVYPKLK